MGKSKQKKAKNVQEIVASGTKPQRCVLVGTYKGEQLTAWRGWYNYPISESEAV